MMYGNFLIYLLMVFVEFVKWNFSRAFFGHCNKISKAGNPESLESRMTQNLDKHFLYRRFNLCTPLEEPWDKLCIKSFKLKKNQINLHKNVIFQFSNWTRINFLWLSILKKSSQKKGHPVDWFKWEITLGSDFFL